MVITHFNLLISKERTDNNCIIDAVNSTEFWERLVIFCNLLKPYDHIIMILESE